MNTTLIKIVLRFVFFCFISLSYAQSKNTFLDRNFWKSEPTISDIKTAIKQGNDPTEKGPFGFDGVAYAIIDNAPVDSIKYMLSLEGNPVTKPTHGGLKYLQWAAYKGNKKVMIHLLELGANPNESSSRGTNMLLMAAIGGIENPEVYDLILEQNISIHYKNTSGANALLLLSAAPIKSTAILHYFISKNVALDSADNDGNNLFFYAAKGGQLPTMKFWKANGVTTNYRNTKGENAVLFAARGMRRQTLDLEVFKYLSEDLNIEVDQVNYKGQTPLHFSARSTNTELFDFFLQAGVSANQVDKNGNIALTNAASGFKNNLEKIAVATSDINHKNNLGKSAITIAITKGRKDHFDFLLSKGADLGITDALGNDLMYYVFKSFSPKNEDLTQYFIKRLKAYGLNGKSLYTNNNTLAHIAIEKHSVFLLEQAIEMGTNINLKNTINLSPLHLAAMKAKNKTIINVLLEHGVEKNTRTEFNESPYDLALQNELLRAKNIDLTVLKTN